MAAAVARKEAADAQMAETAAAQEGAEPQQARPMPEELRSPAPMSPLDLPTVMIPASVAALIEEPPAVLRRVPAAVTEVAVPPRPELVLWPARWEQGELDVDIAALLEPETRQGEGVGLTLTAAWAAIAPLPKFTQDALDFGDDLPSAHVVSPPARRSAGRRPRPRLVAEQHALF